MVAPGGGGVCVVAPGGACVVTPGWRGMHGCSGGACVVAPGGACMIAQGVCVGYDKIRRYGQ